MRGIPLTEKLSIGGDFNGHIRSTKRGYDNVHGGFGFRDRNEGRTALLEFARASGLVAAISSFPKEEEHLVTFRSTVAKTFCSLGRLIQVFVKTIRSSRMRISQPNISSS